MGYMKIRAIKKGILPQETRKIKLVQTTLAARIATKLASAEPPAEPKSEAKEAEEDEKEEQKEQEQEQEQGLSPWQQYWTGNNDRVYMRVIQLHVLSVLCFCIAARKKQYVTMKGLLHVNFHRERIACIEREKNDADVMFALSSTVSSMSSLSLTTGITSSKQKLQTTATAARQHQKESISKICRRKYHERKINESKDVSQLYATLAKQSLLMSKVDLPECNPECNRQRFLEMHARNTLESLSADDRQRFVTAVCDKQIRLFCDVKSDDVDALTAAIKGMTQIKRQLKKSLDEVASLKRRLQHLLAAAAPSDSEASSETDASSDTDATTSSDEEASSDTDAETAGKTHEERLASIFD